MEKVPTKNNAPHFHGLGPSYEQSYFLTSEKGALYLAKNLANLKSLRMLNLSYNEIRHDGALAVVKQITKLPVFEKINLNGNQASFSNECWKSDFLESVIIQ